MEITKVVHTSYASFAKGKNFYLEKPNTKDIESFISNWKSSYENTIGIIDAYSWNVDVYYENGTIKKYQGCGGFPNNYHEFLDYMEKNGKPFKQTIVYKGSKIELL